MLALAHYDGHEKPQSSLAQYIEQTRDKQVNTVLLAAAGNNNSNNNNNHDDIYSVVIMTRSLREFTRFIWRM